VNVKRSAFFDTEEGPWARRNLIVEETNGRRTQIRVDEKTLENALIGMWLDVKSDGIKLQSPRNQ
jgi:hypothetical protein